MLDHDLPSESASSASQASGAPHAAASDISGDITNIAAAASAMSLSRRDLLARGGVLGTAIAAGATVTSAAPATGTAPDPDDPRQPSPQLVPTAILGKRTGVRVSRLAMGGAWGGDSEVLAAGFEHGINYLDTAESYGTSERVIGEFLKARGATGHSKERKKVWLVSKHHDHHNMEVRLPETLERLQQDYLDCYFLHQLQDPTLLTTPEIKTAAQNMKKSGKIRFFGFSCHDSALVECLNKAADSTFVDVIMFRYDFHIFKSDDLDRAVDRCARAGIGLVAMKTQVGGMTLPDRFNPFKLRGINQHQAAVKAVAMDERITSICSQMTTVDHIKQNAEAVAGKLTVAEADALREHGRLISHLWCRACDAICRGASGGAKQIAVADILRFLMYHDHYGQVDHARHLFSELPEKARSLNVIATGDWRSAETACPYNVPIAKLMARATERLG